MKIVIATGIFPPDIGGPATYSKKIAQEFSNLGYQITVVSYGNSNNTSKEKYKIVIIPKKIIWGLRHFAYFAAVLINSRKSEIIYAQDPISAGLPALAASILSGKKFALKVVGDYAWEQGVQRYNVKEMLDEFIQKKYSGSVNTFKILEHFVAMRADLVIVPSEYLKGVAIKWGVRDSKIKVVPNAANKSFSDDHKETGERNDLHVLISVGRLVSWKGFEMLIYLMADLPDCVLYIVGEGPERKKLMSKIENVNLKKRVFLKGMLDENEIGRLYNKSDIFLLNTGYEGFSHQILEAMSAGVPVITTNSGGNVEIAKDNENAVVVGYNNMNEWRDAVKSMLKDRQLMEKLRENAKKTAEYYSKSKMIDETEKALKTII